MLKGRARRGVEDWAQRAAVLVAGGGGGEVGGEEAAEVGGQDLRGHVKAAPRLLTPSGAAHRTNK